MLKRTHMDATTWYDDPTIRAFLQTFRKKHQDVYLILAPPRSASTAFARIFWEHPAIKFYCHEPFDLIYHKASTLANVIHALEHPIDLTPITGSETHARSLVIKEMTFQVGDCFDLAVALSTQPIMFLIRDPRLSIASRMRKLQQGGKNPIFPTVETGWDHLEQQIKRCKERGIPYVIVDSKDLRNHPEAMLAQLSQKIKLRFSPRMLQWKPATTINLGGLGDDQKHWYTKILRSTRLQAADEAIPDLRSFPSTGGFRDHVRACCRLYEALRHDPHIILPDTPERRPTQHYTLPSVRPHAASKRQS